MIVTILMIFGHQLKYNKKNSDVAKFQLHVRDVNDHTNDRIGNHIRATESSQRITKGSRLAATWIYLPTKRRRWRLFTYSGQDDISAQVYVRENSHHYNRMQILQLN